MIDADYRGEVLIRFKYIWQPEDYKIRTDNLLEGTINPSKLYNKGDAVCQLKITKVENVEFVLVDELDSTDRGEGGFGSTDVKKKDNLVSTSSQSNTIETLYANLNKLETPKKYSQLIAERDNNQFNQK